MIITKNVHNIKPCTYLVLHTTYVYPTRSHVCPYVAHGTLNTPHFNPKEHTGRSHRPHTNYLNKLTHTQTRTHTVKLSETHDTKTMRRASFLSAPQAARARDLPEKVDTYIER